MTVMHTARLTLRPWTEYDAPAMHVVFSDEQAMHFWNAPISCSPDDMVPRIRHSISAPAHIHAAWAVVLRETKQPIGFVNYHHVDIANGRLEIGYITARPYWRNGLTTEAVSALLDHCFGGMGMNRVEATIDPDNHASIRLAERLGFRCESGPMRQRLKMPDGRFADVLMFGLLAAGWTDRAARSLESHQ